MAAIFHSIEERFTFQVEGRANNFPKKIQKEKKTKSKNMCSVASVCG